MPMQDLRVTLGDLGSGAAAEMFNRELENVIANICDTNTKADAVRSITLKVKIKPGKERSLCGVEISCESKLESIQPFETAMFVGMEHGVASASEFAPKQQSLFTPPAEEKEANCPPVTSGNVVAFGGR